MISKWSEEIDRDELWEKITLYYEQELSLVRSGLFDVIGHLDYYKKYMDNQEKAKSVWRENEGLLREIFREAIKRGMIPELNTAGFRRKPREQYPSVDILKVYKEEGGKDVVVGTDAHKKDQLLVGIKEAYSIIESLGFGIKIPFNVHKE